MSRILIIGDQSPLVHDIGMRISTVPIHFAVGNADAIQRLRARSFGVVITSCESQVEEDLALLAEMRDIRPGVKCIVLAPESTPEEVIAALRARVFACFTPPFNPQAIAHLAASAASESQWGDDIQVLSAKPGWVSVRVNCSLITAERLLTFAKELSAQLSDDSRQDMILALREILLNAMEHGAAFSPDQLVEITGIRTTRSCVFYVRDPGAGFRQGSLTHAAGSNTKYEPLALAQGRDEEGMRAGGYGLLLAAGTVDELIYSEVGNEVLLIKYV